jgi:hypothetical protein
MKAGIPKIAKKTVHHPLTSMHLSLTIGRQDDTRYSQEDYNAGNTVTSQETKWRWMM